MRCREEELTKAQLQQRIHEESLQKREIELDRREMDLMQRELTIMIIQNNPPQPNKRKGKLYSQFTHLN